MTVRVFVDPASLQSGLLTLDSEEHHYLSKVRRLSTGDELALLDGAGRSAIATIARIESTYTEVEVGVVRVVPAPSFTLSMGVSLIKGERMDWAISKLVELGVSQIRPMTTERTIVRAVKPQRALAKHKRLVQLVRAAARQSFNAHPTSVEPVLPMAKVLPTSASLKLIPCLHSQARPLQEVLPAITPQAAAILIGPEGGFTATEIASAQEAGYLAVALGPRILRAETACIAVATILGFRYGDLSDLAR